MEASNEELLKQFVKQVWNRGDLDAIEDFVSPGYVLRHATSPIYGPNGVRELVAVYREAFPDLVLTVESSIGQGDMVAARYNLRGLHYGHLLGLPPSGRPVNIPGLVMIRFDDDGMQCEEWAQWDTMSAMHQIGAFVSGQNGDRSSESSARSTQGVSNYARLLEGSFSEPENHSS